MIHLFSHNKSLNDWFFGNQTPLFSFSQLNKCVTPWQLSFGGIDNMHYIT